MRFQIANGWPIGQFLIPAGVVINIGDKEDCELTEYEKLAKGRIPPIDICALDADCAVAMWRFYPFSRDRLRRELSPFETETFERLLGMNEAVLQRHWPQGKG
jgi:hypothetical protein